MKWLKLLIDLALIIIPGLALKGKKDIEQELTIAQSAVELLTKDLSPEAKGQVFEDAVLSLKFVQDIKGRGAKKIDKAKNRLYKKFF
ncbi:unnamed protein product [marine sediment metagenome]|uniref:Uncharacterized protein n=1 Tax=marine sediment metagenome TaxID=412755 RepID=X1E4E3_9ZZZZ